MTLLAIRQSGGANIVSIPKAILKALGLHPGSSLDISIESNNIVLTPVKKELTLEELLIESPKAAFALTKEDQEWVNAKPVGKE